MFMIFPALLLYFLCLRSLLRMVGRDQKWKMLREAKFRIGLRAYSPPKKEYSEAWDRWDKGLWVAHYRLEFKQIREEKFGTVKRIGKEESKKFCLFPISLPIKGIFSHKRLTLLFKAFGVMFVVALVCLCHEQMWQKECLVFLGCPGLPWVSTLLLQHEEIF